MGKSFPRKSKLRDSNSIKTLSTCSPFDLSKFLMKKHYLLYDLALGFYVVWTYPINTHGLKWVNCGLLSIGETYGADDSNLDNALLRM